MQTLESVGRGYYNYYNISSRTKYSDPDEMKCAVWAKYSASPQYNHLSFEERTALARTEINMTLFGEVDYSSAQIVGKINGDTGSLNMKI